MEVQERAIRAWARQQGSLLVTIARDEGISGSNGLEARVGLSHTLELVRTGGARGLLVYRLDRLARDLVLQEQLLAEIRRMGAGVFTTSAAEAGYLSGQHPLASSDGRSHRGAGGGPITKSRLSGTAIRCLPTTKIRAKGLTPYHPRPGSRNHLILNTALEVIERYRNQGRLPLGSRETGYVFTGLGLGFTKRDIDAVEDVLVRARRAGLIQWDCISDGRTSVSKPWTPSTPEDAADVVLAELDEAHVDRQRGQKYQVEIWAEAASWVERLERMCHEYGVPVYSGSGSVPLDAGMRCAMRAVRAWTEHEQETVILHIGDLDVHGLARPFEADLHQFVVDMMHGGTHMPGYVSTVVHVRRLLITPEHVVEHVPEAARDQPTATDRAARWLWDYKAQAEALLPEIRDQIVVNALDALSDPNLRAEATAAEDDLRSASRAVLRARLDHARSASDVLLPHRLRRALLVASLTSTRSAPITSASRGRGAPGPASLRHLQRA